MTDQPPSQQPSDEPDGDIPAAFASDSAPTTVSPPGPASTPEPAGAPESPGASAPAGADGSGSVPPTSSLPPPVIPPPPSEEGAFAGGSLESVFPPDRPERAVGAAFAGGIVLALILKSLAR